jgi:hypothetical protein
MLSSFRELLLRKTTDEDLKKSIEDMGFANLSDYIIETLEKMAGRDSNANAPLKDFVHQAKMEKEQGEMSEAPMAGHIRDAMGHHASAYKTAMQNNDDEGMRKHAKMFLTYGHLADKMQNTEGANAHKDIIKLDSIPLSHWQFKHPHFEDRGQSKAPNYTNPTGWSSHYKISKSDGSAHGTDYSWLRGDPHPERTKDSSFKIHTAIDEDGKESPHSGPYPMEHVKINDKYIPITKGATGDHPLDSHPLVHRSKPNEDPVFVRSPDKVNSNRYTDELHDFVNSPFYEKLNDIDHSYHSDKPGPQIHSEKYGNDKKAPVPTAAPVEAAPEASVVAPKARTKRDIYNDISNLDVAHPDYNKNLDSLINEMKNAK